MKGFSMLFFPKGYVLSLRDNNKWWITGDNDTIQWVDELARILELKEDDPDKLPRLIFTNILDNKISDIIEYFKITDPGWKCYDRKIFRLWHHDSFPDVICEINIINELRYINMWNALQPIYWQSIQNGGLPFHCALAELEGKGILIAAPGDTGKSTCCRRLPDYWKPLGDDESLIVLINDKYFVHPFPTWSNYIWKTASYTWNVQYSVPLHAIFFLEQSKTDEVIPLRIGKAASYVNESSVQVCQKFWANTDNESKIRFRTALFNNACDVAKNIPAFRLCASLHGKFWEEIEKVIQ
jgi:SynChlorMet cassette protein ScmC